MTAVPATVRDIMMMTLVKKAKVQNTRWVGLPNLALITYNKIDLNEAFNFKFN